MVWAAEDGGPRRTQTVGGGLGLAPGDRLAATTRMAPAVTMVVGGAAPGAGTGGRALYLLRHGAGEGATAVVERIDPVTLEPLATSAELAGGPVWPGGMAVAGDGSLHVVFGNHAHRLSPDLEVLAACELPRARPYNSFVTVGGGVLVTKDFGGSLPGAPVPADERQPCELVALDPQDLSVRARLALPEPSIARLSADDDDVYVVGDNSLLRVRWDGAALVADGSFRPRYRTRPGQGFGWDCVLAGGSAWFLDDGDGGEAFDGTLRGHGLATAPLQLLRVDLATGEVAAAEICGRPGGLVVNPPVVDPGRGVAVGYDSGNGELVGFDAATLAPRWRRSQDHGSHLLLYAGTGELVTGDHADVVVLDIATGDELARVDTGSGMQSVLFPCPGWDRDFYVTTLFSVTRVAVGGD